MNFIELDLTAVALALVRISLGILFLFQAYDKIFKVGLKLVYTTLISSDKAAKGLSKPFVKMSIGISSYIELIGGALLIAGVFLDVVYPVLAINLLMLVLAFSFLQPMWDMKHVWPRLVMLVFLMVMSPEADLYSIDWFISDYLYYPL